MTKIKKCSCKNPYQDSKYGEGLRVFNKTANDKLRCTICSKEIGSDKEGKK